MTHPGAFALRPLPRHLTLTTFALVAGTLALVARRSGDLRVVLPGAPWLVLERDRPVRAEGIYGLRRDVRTLGLGVDDPALLAAALVPAAATTPDDECR